MRTLTIAIAIALCACTSSPYYHRSYTPSSGTSASSKGELYAKAMSAVAETNLTIETNDAAAGLIVTSWECTSAAGCSDKTRLNVTVYDGGYSVTVPCQYQNAMGQWQDCGTDRDTRPQKYLDAQAMVVSRLH